MLHLFVSLQLKQDQTKNQIVNALFITNLFSEDEFKLEKEIFKAFSENGLT